MAVRLTPNFALGFPRPFTHGVKRTLTIKNNNAEPITYRVETTAPSLYDVKYNRGRLLPGHRAQVRVSLRAMKHEPPLNAISNDKIIIKSTVIAPEKVSMTSDQIWGSLDVQNSTVHQQEIKIVHVPSPDQNVNDEGAGAGAHNPSQPTLTQGDSMTTSSADILMKVELLNQGGSRYVAVRPVTDQSGGRAVDSEFQPLLVPEPIGAPSFISEPFAPVAPAAPRRRIWTYIKRLIQSRSKKRKGEKKLFTPVAPIPPIDRKIPPPAYCSVAGAHSQDEKRPHPPPSVQEHAPNFMPTTYAVVQLAQQLQEQPLASESEVERELREQLHEHPRTLLASVPERDAPALRRYSGPLHSVADGDTKIVSISSSRPEVGTVVGSAVVRTGGLAPNVVAMIALLVFMTTGLLF